MNRNLLLRRIRLTGNVVALGSTILVAYFMFEQRAVFGAIEFTYLVFLSISACIAIYIVTVFGNAFRWIFLIRATGFRIDLRSGLWIFLSSQYAKYLPGNLWHMVARTGLASLHSIHPAHTLYVIGIELALIVFIGGLFSLSLIDDEFSGANYRFVLLTIAIALGLIIFSNGTGYILAFLRKLSRIAGPRWEIPALAKPPPIRTLVLAATLTAINFIINAVILKLAATSLVGGTTPSVTVLAAVFAFAWTIGFITPGSPGGIGIRDGLLAAGLVPFLGSSTSAIVIVVHRLVSLVGDTLCFAFSALIRTSESKKQNS